MDAIVREKRLKRWNRLWKMNLIEKTNAGWDDLAESIGVTENVSQVVQMKKIVHRVLWSLQFLWLHLAKPRLGTTANMAP